jgi:hypothetical protein
MNRANLDSVLGTAANTRNKLSGVTMLVVIVSIVLSIMVIHTRNTCVNERDVDKFKDKSNFMYVSSILLLVMALMLFVYDIAIMFKVL